MARRLRSPLPAALVVLSLATPATAREVVVETLTGTAHLFVGLPGVSNGSNGLRFSPVDLDFLALTAAPGAVVFEGQPLDFVGFEPSFLVGQFQGSWTLDADAGPATVDGGSR